MKVYLSCPIVGGRRLKIARLLHDVISETGHDVISKWLVSDDPGFSLSPSEVYRRDTDGIRSADIVVADVSNPSHGVGMEMMLALMLGKTIISLAPKRTRISRMLLGAPDIIWIRYSDLKSLKSVMKRMLKSFSR